jgi:hypothetical protein
MLFATLTRDCYINVSFPSCSTLPPRPLTHAIRTDHKRIQPNMACPLLDKLPPELRRKIYEYVLYFDDVPLRHVKQLQPFIKKLTGGDGELPFSYEDRGKRGPELDWIMCDDELLGSRQTETGILSTCKTVHTEGK